MEVAKHERHPPNLHIITDLVKQTCTCTHTKTSIHHDCHAIVVTRWLSSPSPFDDSTPKRAGYIWPQKLDYIRVQCSNHTYFEFGVGNHGERYQAHTVLFVWELQPRVLQHLASGRPVCWVFGKHSLDKLSSLRLEPVPVWLGGDHYLHDLLVTGLVGGIERMISFTLFVSFK